MITCKQQILVQLRLCALCLPGTGHCSSAKTEETVTADFRNYLKRFGLISLARTSHVSKCGAMDTENVEVLEP